MARWAVGLLLLLACRPPAAAVEPAVEALFGLGEEGRLRFTLALEPEAPGLGELFAVVTQVVDAESGRGVEGLVVAVDATMPEHAHGMTTTPVHAEVGGGTYESEGLKLHMPGSWLFEVRASGRLQDVLRVRWTQGFVRRGDGR